MAIAETTGKITSIIVNDSLNTSQSVFSVIANPVVLSFVLPIMFVIVLMIVAVRNVLPVSHFLYANARIQAKNGSTVKESLLRDLTEAKSLNEFRNLLSDTPYYEWLEKSGEDLREFHKALEKGLIKSIVELIELSPEKSKPLFNSYIKFFEAKIIKIIYGSKLRAEKIDPSLVYSIGIINHNILRHLMDTESVADMKVVLSTTIYKKIFEKDYENIKEFEVAIDKFIYKDFIETITKTKMHDGNLIMDVLNKKINIANSLAILKLRIRGIEKEKQKNYLIESKTEVYQMFDKLIDAKNMHEFVECYKGLPYFESLKIALEKYEKDHALSHFENELFRFFKKYVSSFDPGHTLGPYPLFSYLIKRELEVRNLFVISRGIDAGFSVKKIREMVI